MDAVTGITITFSTVPTFVTDLANLDAKEAAFKSRFGITNAMLSSIRL